MAQPFLVCGAHLTYARAHWRCLLAPAESRTNASAMDQVARVFTQFEASGDWGFHSNRVSFLGSAAQMPKQMPEIAVVAFRDNHRTRLFQRLYIHASCCAVVTLTATITLVTITQVRSGLAVRNIHASIATTAP